MVFAEAVKTVRLSDLSHPIHWSSVEVYARKLFPGTDQFARKTVGSVRRQEAQCGQGGCTLPTMGDRLLGEEIQPNGAVARGGRSRR